MLCAIPVGMLQKTLAVIWGHAILLLLLVSSVDLDILYSGCFFHHGNSIALLYLCNISTWVVYANGKHPNSQKFMTVWASIEKWNFLCPKLANIMVDNIFIIFCAHDLNIHLIRLFRQGNWDELTFAKISGTVTGDEGENWLVAGQCVPR